MPHPARFLALPALAALTLSASSTAPPRPQRVIPVRLTDFHITMPDTVQQGPVIFAVTNAGREEHQFSVRGRRRLQASRHLKPGETVQMPIRLVVGEYVTYCNIREPNENHRALGMEHTIRVVW